MKKILARGGIEFLAVLLGITVSLQIEKNRLINEQERDREVVYELINKEVDQLIEYTDNKLEEYATQTSRIQTLLINWDTFKADTIKDYFSYYGDCWFTYIKGYDPDFTSYEALLADGRINLIDIELRKKLGTFYELITQVQRVELNDNEMRNEMIKYITKTHPKIYREFAFMTFDMVKMYNEEPNKFGYNFFKFIELTRFDKTIFSLFSTKSAFVLGRNNHVKDYREVLGEIKTLLNNQKISV